MDSNVPIFENPRTKSLHPNVLYCTVHVFEKCIFFLLKKRCWISNLQYLPSQLQSNMITTCADDTLIKKETITCSIKPKICRLGQIQNYLLLKLLIVR